MEGGNTGNGVQGGTWAGGDPRQGHIENNQIRKRFKNSLRLKTYDPNNEKFFPKTILDWNTIPQDTVTEATRNTFKDKITNVILTK